MGTPVAAKRHAIARRGRPLVARDGAEVKPGAAQRSDGVQH